MVRDDRWERFGKASVRERKERRTQTVHLLEDPFSKSLLVLLCFDQKFNYCLVLLLTSGSSQKEQPIYCRSVLSLAFLL